ncbi:UDP-N-acetylmuramoyl-tripeptide--D-alanyl-D-alanine ligase, partial [Desmospora sp. 8437]
MTPLPNRMFTSIPSLVMVKEEAVLTKSVTLNQCIQIIGGTLMRGDGSRILRGANLGKPRRLAKNQIYFYSKSRSWDKQLAGLQSTPPAAAVLPEGISWSSIPKSVAIVRVSDVNQAIWRLANWNWRQVRPQVAAVTGSAGKSTTTSMVTSILKRSRRVVHTQGNLNTFTYLPSYLLRLSPGDEFLMLEMGMKSFNNIARQCRVVRPEVGAVTNVGEAHAGQLGGVHRVVKAKQELIDGLRPGATLYLNADCLRSKQLSTRRFRGSVYTFGIRNPADIQGSNIQYSTNGVSFDVMTEGKRGRFFIPTWGDHNVLNALAAIGIARALGIGFHQIRDGLAKVKLPRMRLQRIRGSHGRTLINDAWNANPSAMKAGLSVLRYLSSKRPGIAVLGDMMELGGYTRAGHREVGRFAARMNLHQLITYGQKAREIGRTALAAGMDPHRVRHFSNRGALLRHLLSTPAGSVIYFKASRKQNL